MVNLFRRFAEMSNIYCRSSFSQDGEDRVLSKLLDSKKNGFYVEVGGYHPDKFSNTRIFYNRGWSGLVIDPSPLAADLFRKKRPKDKFISCGIGVHNTKKLLHLYDEGAWNTFSNESHSDILKRGFPKHLGDVEVQMMPLSAVLDKHLPKNTTIDFLSIDAEGFDLEVITSNNWDKYRPAYIVVEDGSENLISSLHSESTVFLTQHGYIPIAKTGNSSFYAIKS